MLQNKKIILGVTGSIAAYKSALLVREFIKEGAEVQVIMTVSAKDFISPLTLATLSKRPVISDYFNPADGQWSNHVELGLWADFVVIAPSTANTIAKMANGICDDVLLATYLSARCPVYLAPAMDLDMFAHPSTIRNLAQLKKDGVNIIPVESGELASGLEGKGRMAEPENILKYLQFNTSNITKLEGKRVLITAGPTYENVDPVRFIGNRSSGKMGVALAHAFSAAGAEVELVLGPSSQSPVLQNINLHRVTGAEEMAHTCQQLFAGIDIAVMSAAVADFTPKVKYDIKLKKSSDEMTIDLVKTTDILANLGKQKKANQTVIGFALETHNELENGLKKLKNKNADLIVLNSLNDEGAGFSTDTNKVTLLYKSGDKDNLPLMSKSQLAIELVNKVAQL